MKDEEQDIRIEARDWCSDMGASENQVENIALHFYNKGKQKTLKAFCEDAEVKPCNLRFLSLMGFECWQQLKKKWGIE